MKYLRRLVWYIVGKLSLIVALLGVLSIAFYFSMNSSNIYIIMKDGMAKRAQVVMMGLPEEEMENYFSPSYLNRDPVLATVHNGTNPYTRYRINGIDHRLKMEWLWCWPWEDEATATVVERVPGIDGRILGEYKTTLKESQWSVPRWESGRYKVLLAKENGRWLIKNLERTALIDETKKD